MLFSIDIRVLGKPNVPLFSYGEIFSGLIGAYGADLYWRTCLVAVLLAGLLLLLLAFLRTEVGMALRAVGVSRSMARAQGISVGTYTVLGLGLANAVSAGGGALLAQNQSFADVNLGLGVLVNGLAALIVGEQLIGRGSLPRQLLAPLLGALVYYQIVSFALALGLRPSDLKLLTGLFVLALLALPALRRRGVPAELAD